MNKRSTIYFEPELHKALRMKAANTERSISDLVNDSVRQALREDQEDLAAFEERAAEPTITYERSAAGATIRVQREGKADVITWVDGKGFEEGAK